jgi:prolyl 4-hydroxylase
MLVSSHLERSLGIRTQEHHDWIDYQADRAEGARILTVFFYLNTVEAGGGTRFPRLDLTVQPVKGRVLIWPSTLNEDPDAKDVRTNHEALPVEKGIKYGANAWIHQRDYKTPSEKNCT